MKIANRKAFASRPSCVLLDLDNTLYDYDPCHEAGTRAAQALAQQTLNLSTADFARCAGDARLEVKSRLGPTAASHSRLLYFQRAIERAGFASQPFTALNLEQAYWRAYLDAMKLFEGAREFLDDLRIAGIPAVIVTDLTAQIQFRKMVALELDKLIDWIVTSEESGRDKPDPASFELALAKLGGVEGTVWMIGDNIDCDLAGASSSLGAVTIAKSGGAPGAFRPDASFTSFSDLRKLFRDLPDA